MCPACLFGLALSPIEADDGPDVAPPAGIPGLAAGRVLGDRYRIRSFLGRGGMGEVWRGYDVKLSVDVALKTVREDLPPGRRALDGLRREVRMARQVSSPNVCRVFDLVEVDGLELVCMEYVDGVTLARVLRERAPLAVGEAQEIASQFLAGLSAIHQAGLVHRDLKPENVMLTRAGRVVVMDLGIAHWARSMRGALSGTPPFMSPEQARGETVDARSDVFAAGVILGEMVDPGGVATEAARAGVWDGIAADPPRVAETPWARVIRQAVSADRARRYESAFAVARALEEVTLRSAGAEDARPYPGLVSFEAEDAAFFFGREVEIEAVWRKLSRPRLLGLIGPSGAGKSSFLRAGLVPARPEGWGAVVTTPGARPFAALAQAFLPELESDPDAVAELLRFDDLDVAVSVVGRWRRRHANALVVVDQFEELFTQNPEPVQEAYVRVLHRLVLEADAHLLVAMRDDFLFHCQRFEALQPVFAELTPLGAPTGAALRRAIVQPALKCGYRFEDEALIEAMIAEVEGERGALPLLAFACAQLWERRDRERGVLSRAAYQEIGGVAGALAQHAEATLERIGLDKVPLVREIFRNLVTAEGTRAARDRDELLSVFPAGERDAVGGILDTLVGSRLLVSYEAKGEGPERRRLEIVHESLLTRWPRLLRWRAQDAEGAVLRDQLRQAAQLWDKRNRAEAFLWTGTAHREYQLWRERYPGGLTALEEAFGWASTALAQRRRRRRNIAVAAAFAVLATGLAVVTVLRQQAVAEARRAEASKLLALGQVELEASPTAALAYGIKSLELDDTHTARVFALKALAAGPPASVHLVDIRETGRVRRVVFSPDGAWAAVVTGSQTLHVISRDGSPPVHLQAFPAGSGLVSPVFDAGHLYAAKHGLVRIWRVPGFDLVETQTLGGTHTLLRRTQAGVLATTRMSDEPRNVVVAALAVGMPPREIGRLNGFTRWDIDPAGGSVAFASEKKIYLRSLDGDVDPREIGRYEGQPQLLFHPEGDRLAAYDDTSRQIRIWPVKPGADTPMRALTAPFEPLTDFTFDSSGGRLAAIGTTPGGALRAELWDLDAPTDQAAKSFPAKFGGFLDDATFSPNGRWLVTSTFFAICFWPVEKSEARILRGHRVGVTDVRFTPDGGRLVSVDRVGEVREWGLGPGAVGRTLAQVNMHAVLDMDRQGRFVAVTHPQGAAIVSLADGDKRVLKGFEASTGVGIVAIEPGGRRVAAASGSGARHDKVIRVWDLKTGGVQVLGPTEQAGEGILGQIYGLGFLADGSLISAGDDGLQRWMLPSGAHERIAPSYIQSHLTVFPDGRSVVYTVGSERESGEGAGSAIQYISAVITDVVTRKSTVLRAHGGRIMPVAVDPTGRIVVTGSRDGIVRVGLVSGEEPHLLIGHEGFVHTVDISPDGRWIASAGDDRTVRIWPMPDLSKPPLQTLPRVELLARLKRLTNVRVVDESSSTLVASLRSGRGTGYELDILPFPGWAEVPEP